MFDHIVVPLDGSALSEAALPYIVPLALRLNSRVVLLHANNDPYADIFGEGTLARSIEKAQSSGAAYLRGVSERLCMQGVRCETHHELGAPAAVILRYIEERKPDLVAMSTHGRSGLRRMVVGSVTTTILPRAETPVLVIRPDEDTEQSETSFENLVLPLDMSSRSEDVIPLVTELADTLDLSTSIITCLPSPSQLYTGSVPEVYPYPDDLVQQTQEAAEEYLQKMSASFNEESGIEMQAECLEGGPARKIIEYAAAQPNCLIAMCTQGRTGLGRWVLGSVTDAVIRSGNTPVLVVPHSDDDS